MIVARKNKYSE